MIVYYNGKYMPKSDVAISPDDRGFLFADGIYEVVRVYEGHLFRLAEHLKRLETGVTALGIGGVDPAQIGEIVAGLIEQNQLGQGDATVYVQVTRGAAPRSHKFPPANTPPTIYGEPKRLNPLVSEPESGVGVVVVPDQRWARCDLKTTGLLANTIAHQRAFKAGAFEAIFCRDGMLMEGSHSSVMFVKNNTLLAPPLSNYILPSVTRQVVLELAAAAGIEVMLRPCREDELGEFQEALLVGTTVEVTPITSVDGRPIGGGKPGPLTRRLQAAFAEGVRRERKAR